MAIAVISAIFTDNGAGKTGLSPTITIEQIGIASGSPTKIVNAAAMTESANINGAYWYRTADVIDVENYQYIVYCTSAGTVDNAHLFSEIGQVPPDSGVVIGTATRQGIADEILKRDLANVDGAAAEHSLYTLIMGKLETALSGSTWTIYETDGTTTHITKTVTTNAAADPVTAVT